jgi:hypothetical protein
MGKITDTAQTGHVDEKISQNIKDILKDIGELSTLFYLYYHFNRQGWAVYKNYNEKGYDILLVNEKKHQRKKIEVKTRRKLMSSRTNKNRNTHFTLTEIERSEADYLVGLWYEHHYFFIVPTSDLKVTRSGNKKLYKFIVSLNRRGELNHDAEKYLGNWKLIIS